MGSLSPPASTPVLWTQAVLLLIQEGQSSSLIEDLGISRLVF